MKAVDDAVDTEVEAAEGVGEEAVDVTKGVLTAAADLLSKTGVVLLIIIIVGIVLLVVRDLIYQASAWSTTELVLIVGSWDLWSALGPPRPTRKNSPAAAGSCSTTTPTPRSEIRNTARHASTLTQTRPGKSHCSRSRGNHRRPQGVWHRPRLVVLAQQHPQDGPRTSHLAVVRLGLVAKDAPDSQTHRELKKLSEQVGVCQELGTGPEVFSFAIKYLANDRCIRPPDPACLPL